MAVVIRLRGLRNTASPADIRNFFTGLNIPYGGVHIIGGELEEAFIIFNSDDDARRAMRRSGGFIKGTSVHLFSSSKSEMEMVLEENTRCKADQMYYDECVRRPMLEERRSFEREINEDVWRGDSLETGNRNSWTDFPTGREGLPSYRGGIYVYLSGMPFTARKEDIYDFFDGLLVNDIILFQKNGEFSGCGLVQFGTPEDASEGLKRDRKYMGHRYVRVLTSSRHQWVKSGGTINPVDQPRHAFDPSRSRSPIRNRSRSPLRKEFCVLYENIPFSVRKSDIKGLLHPVSLMDYQINIFVEDHKSRTQSAVVAFRNLQDYCSGLTHDKEMFFDRVLQVSPISKEAADAMIEMCHHINEERRSSSRSIEGSKNSFSVSERCVHYVRNLPFDVRKVEIMDFFFGFQLSEDRIFLLHDETGAGLGEALVTFKTEKDAMRAEALNGQRFLGSKVMLKCITWSKMQEFGVSLPDGGKTSFQSDFSKSSNDQRFSDRDPGNNGQIRQFKNPNVNGQASRSSNKHCKSNDSKVKGPTCVQLLNLPTEIDVDEIYDFCYGYRVVSGSVSLQFKSSGEPTGTATVVFETHVEALTAMQELDGRPIGTRRITVKFL